MAEETKAKKPMDLQALAKKLNTGKGMKNTAKVGTELSDTTILCSTGSFALNLGLGLGGLPDSRIMEYYGQPSGGKSTMSFISGIELQKLGQNIAVIDIEGTFDKKWFVNLGGDLDKLLIIVPDSGAIAFTKMVELLESGIIGLVIVDSVSTMLTDAQINKGFGEDSMAQLARLMSDSLPKVNNVMNKLVKKNGKCASIIFINQMRVTNMSGYGNPQSATGGNALPFYASVRLEISRVSKTNGGNIGSDENPIGFKTQIKVVKNKIGPPFRKVITSLYIQAPKFGIDIDAEMFDLAVYYNIIMKRKKDEDGNFVIDPDGKGAWYLMSDDEIDWIYGRDKAIEHFLADRELFTDVKERVIDIVDTKGKAEEDSFEAKKLAKDERKSRTTNKDEI